MESVLLTRSGNDWLIIATLVILARSLAKLKEIPARQIAANLSGLRIESQFEVARIVRTGMLTYSLWYRRHVEYANRIWTHFASRASMMIRYGRGTLMFRTSLSPSLFALCSLESYYVVSCLSVLLPWNERWTRVARLSSNNNSISIRGVSLTCAVIRTYTNKEWFCWGI